MLRKSDSDVKRTTIYTQSVYLFLSCSIVTVSRTHTHTHRVRGHRWHGGVRVRGVCWGSKSSNVWPLHPSLAFFFSSFLFVILFLPFLFFQSHFLPLLSFCLLLHLSSFPPLICPSEVWINYSCFCLSQKPCHLSSTRQLLCFLSSVTLIPSSFSVLLLSPSPPSTLPPPLSLHLYSCKEAPTSLMLKWSYPSYLSYLSYQLHQSLFWCCLTPAGNIMVGHKWESAVHTVTLDFFLPELWRKQNLNKELKRTGRWENVEMHLKL